MNAKVANVLTKTIGAAGLGLVLYDAHHAGKIEAPMAELKGKSTSLSHHYLEDLKLDTPSTVKNAAKKGIFHYHLDETLTGFFHSTGGYVGGFASMLVNNVVPLALSVGTLVGGKGLFSKACGLGLLAYGGIFIMQEGFGFGKKKGH